jgi:hypothetical protein
MSNWGKGKFFGEETSKVFLKRILHSQKYFLFFVYKSFCET